MATIQRMAEGIAYGPVEPGDLLSAGWLGWSTAPDPSCSRHRAWLAMVDEARATLKALGFDRWTGLRKRPTARRFKVAAMRMGRHEVVIQDGEWIIASPEERTHEDLVDARLDIAELLGLLTERQAGAVRAYDLRGLTLVEVGLLFGISESGVSLLRKRAIEEMRSYLIRKRVRARMRSGELVAKRWRAS